MASGRGSGALFAAALALASSVAAPLPAAAASGPTTMTLLIQANGTVPGFDQVGLQRYLAQQISTLDIPGWHFQPAGLRTDPPPNRLQWSFKLNPYAGGSRRSIGPGAFGSDGQVGLHRYVSVEVRLYIAGDYQTLSSGQTDLDGGPNDAKLAAIVDSLTRSVIANGADAPPPA